MQTIIAIGSNLEDKHQHLLNAEKEILQLPKCSHFIFSSIYQTVSIGENEAPYYLNAVASFNTELNPYQLLEKLQKIEDNNERKRSYVNAPRTLDLDILFMFLGLDLLFMLKNS